MSTTTIKKFWVRAFNRVRDALAGMNYAQRRVFELRTEPPQHIARRQGR